MLDDLLQLTQTQLDILNKLSRGKIKAYQIIAGLPSDKDPDGITREFNECLTLCEYGLLADVSDWPQYIDCVINEKKNTGRDVAVVRITCMGDKMFQRTPWLKYKN